MQGHADALTAQVQPISAEAHERDVAHGQNRNAATFKMM
jgi:hypothetical protein